MAQAIYNELTGEWEQVENPWTPYDTTPTQAPSTSAPIATTAAPATTGGGKSRDQIIAEGQDYDRQHGYIGGYFDDQTGVWVNGSPSSSGPSGGDTPTGYQAPARRPLAALNYPGFAAPTFQAPTPFAYKDYQLPTLAEAQAEPGFDYALQQGLKAYENSKAYLGTYKTGGTIKGLNDYARNMATQNYDKVVDRSFKTYDTNRNNAADSYATNYGISRDVFDRNYTAAKDMYAPKAREAELNFARDWDQYAYEGDDDYRRWKAMIDANTP